MHAPVTEGRSWSFRPLPCQALHLTLEFLAPPVLLPLGRIRDLWWLGLRLLAPWDNLDWLPWSWGESWGGRLKRRQGPPYPPGWLVQSMGWCIEPPPQRNRMCSSSVYMQMRRRGWSISRNVAIISSHDIGDVPCFSSSKLNSAWKVMKMGSSIPEAPSAARVSGATCYRFLPKSSGGSHVRGIYLGACWFEGAWICLGRPLFCHPVYCLTESSCIEATDNASSCILDMMDWRSGVCTSPRILALSVPSPPLSL